MDAAPPGHGHHDGRHRRGRARLRSRRCSSCTAGPDPAARSPRWQPLTARHVRDRGRRPARARRRRQAADRLRAAGPWPRTSSRSSTRWTCRRPSWSAPPAAATWPSRSPSAHPTAWPGWCSPAPRTTCAAALLRRRARPHHRPGGPGAGCAASLAGFTDLDRLPSWYVDLLVEDALRLPAPIWTATLPRADHLARRRPTLGVITAPTLVISGGRDGLLGRGQTDALVAAVPGAQWIEYEDTGHLRPGGAAGAAGGRRRRPSSPRSPRTTRLVTGRVSCRGARRASPRSRAGTAPARAGRPGW